LHVINRDALLAPSEAAYEDGLSVVMRVGPFGGARGLSKLVRVRWLEPIRRGATVAVPMRWEATGATGELFPVLDADLILTPQGKDETLVRLTGSYRPPFGRAGAVIDSALMHGIASATIRSLLHSVGVAITDQADPSVRGAGMPVRPSVSDTE
jgi:hypothetical protein